MQMTLTRDVSRLDCTEGILNVGAAQYFTIEPPWLNDEPDKSCVPPGLYDLVPHVIANGVLAGLHTWALSNPALGVYPEPPTLPLVVNQYPVRVACLLHPANWAFQLEGCIAPGKARGLLAPEGGELQPAVLSSDDAFQEIVRLLGPDSTGHTLLIQEGA